jgi:hypothetical protein
VACAEGAIVVGDKVGLASPPVLSLSRLTSELTSFFHLRIGILKTDYYTL